MVWAVKSITWFWCELSVGRVDLRETVETMGVFSVSVTLYGHRKVRGNSDSEGFSRDSREVLHPWAVEGQRPQRDEMGCSEKRARPAWRPGWRWV